MRIDKRENLKLKNEKKYLKRIQDEERRESNKEITDKMVLDGYLIVRCKNSKVYIYKEEKLIKTMKNVQKEMFLKKVIRRLGEL